MKKLQEAGTVFSPRCTSPELGDATTTLLGFGDGSTLAYAAMIYMISTSPNGKVEVNLVPAKARVAPLGGTTTPRMEISLAALLSRLALLVLENCGLRPRAVFMALDCECVVAALQRCSGLLKPLFAHRAAEIDDNIKEMRKLCFSVDPKFSGEENPVDIATRGTADVAYTPREKWPI